MGRQLKKSRFKPRRDLDDGVPAIGLRSLQHNHKVKLAVGKKRKGPICFNEKWLDARTQASVPVFSRCGNLIAVKLRVGHELDTMSPERRQNPFKILLTEFTLLPVHFSAYRLQQIRITQEIERRYPHAKKLIEIGGKNG